MLVGNVSLVTCILLALFITPGLSGSCREAKLCCTGRDSSCVVQKAPLNAIIEDLNDKPCYCDHACLKLGDCCGDFKAACGVIDCRVSTWGRWSECDRDCGSGMTTRKRTVLTAPENGGKHCPALVQNRACQGTRCPFHVKTVIKETAMLLPVRLAQSRKINETADVRRNLKYVLENTTMEPPKNQYCVKFEVLKASKQCRKEISYSGLKDGDPVCILCEVAAMQTDGLATPRCTGHGSDGRITRWEALSAPHCRGKWLRLQAVFLPEENNEEPQCNLCNEGASFIFV